MDELKADEFALAKDLWAGAPGWIPTPPRRRISCNRTLYY